MFRNLNCPGLGITGLSSEVIESLLSNHFRSIDLDLVAFAQEAEQSGLPKARRLFDSARLKLGSYDLPIALGADQAEFAAQCEGAKKLMALAQQLGGARATVAIEPATDSRPFHENFEFHRRRLSEVSKLLAGHGQRLGVSFSAPLVLRDGRAYQFIQTVDQLLLLLRMTDAGAVGISLDLWHWQLGGGTIEQLAAFKPEQITNVVLSDLEPGITAANATEAARQLPGETGVIDCAAVLVLLKEKGYNGPLTPLADKGQFSATGRDKIIRAAGVALDKVCGAAGISTVVGKSPALAGK